MLKYLLTTLVIGGQILYATNIQSLTLNHKTSDHVEFKEKKYYTVSVPKGKYIKVNVTNLEADVDLYLKTGSKPRIRNNQCYSSNSRTADEECLYKVTSDKNVYILVYGFKESSFNITASILDKDTVETLEKNVEVKGNLKKGESQDYRIKAKKGETLLFSLESIEGDADIRVKVGRKANIHVFNCKSTKGKGQQDRCTITLKKDATVYAHINGYKDSKYNFVVSNPTLDTFPKTRFYTQNKKYFFAYEKVRHDGHRATKVVIVNSQTKQVSHLEHFSHMGGTIIKQIKGADLVNINNHIYAINAGGKLININDKIVFDYAGERFMNKHYANQVTNNIFKAEAYNNNLLIQVKYDVRNILVPTLIDEQHFKGDSIPHYIVKYNCNQTHANNQIKLNEYYRHKLLCSTQQENEAYIIYGENFTLVNIEHPNPAIKILDNHNFLTQKHSSFANELHKIDEKSFYVVSSKFIGHGIEQEKRHSIYRDDKLIFAVKQFVGYDSLAIIKNIKSTKSNKIVIELEKSIIKMGELDQGTKTYDISDITNPKLIQDDFPNEKLIILK